MIARAKLTFNEEYFSGYYADWIKSRSRYRKYAPLGGLGVLGIGIAVLYFLPSKPVFGTAVVLLGLAYLADVLTYRGRWIRERLDSGGSETGTVEFYDDRIRMESERSEGYYLISGFVAVIPAARGVFLIPQKGITFYIPWRLIEPADAMDQVKKTLGCGA